MKLFERDEPEVKPAPEVQVAAEAARRDEAPVSQKAEEQPAPVPAAARADEGLSVIGKTLFVKGEVEAAEDMLVEGRMEGSIKHTANQLTIGVSGVVNADIDAKNLVIEGTVEGNIVGAESVVIKDSADVRGNVYTARISIADGAQFSGTVDMDISKSPKH
jgi:cytoskeletal protein CcmA (bactofilin family)